MAQNERYLSAKEIFAKYISAFDTNKTIGIQSHYTLMVRNDRDGDFSTLDEKDFWF